MFSLAFSPDSKKLLTGGTYRALRIWDVETGKEVLPRQGHLDAVLSLLFSPDGKTLASRGADQCVRVWDLKTLKERHRLSLGETEQYNPLPSALPYPSTSLAYSPDGKTLAAIGGMVGRDGMPSAAVHLWDTADYRTSRELRYPRFGPVAVGFSPDPKILATARGGQGGVRLWDITKAESFTVLDDAQPDQREGSRSPRILADAVAFSADSRTLAVAGRTKVLLWDWTSAKQLATLPPQPGKTGPRVRSASVVTFSPGGHLLAVGASEGSGAQAQRDRVIHLYEPATGSLAFTLTTQFARRPPPPESAFKQKKKEKGEQPPLPPAEVHAIAFSPDGRLLALACGDGTVRVWDVFAQKQLAAWKGHEGDVLTVAFSPDGKTLASGGLDTTILLWDVRGLSLTKPVAGESTLKELDADLKSSDAGKAYRAVWHMAGHGEDAVNHLRKTLTPVPKLDAGRLKRLIEQLEDEDLKVREAASAELEKLGLVVEPALRRTLADKPKPETRRRISRLLTRFDALRKESGELFRSRSLLVLELIGTTAARAFLRELASGEPDAPLTREAKLARLDLTKQRAAR